MSPPLIIGIIGQNANGALAHATAQTGQFWQAHGYDHAIVDFQHPAASQQLLQYIARQRPFFAYGLAGIGSELSHEGVNLWEILRVPFLSMLFDHPCYMPERHAVKSQYVVNCYYCRDFLEAGRDFIDNPPPAYLLTPDFPGHEAGLTTPWAARDIGIVFAKSGGRAAEIVEGWQNNLPAALNECLLAIARRLHHERHHAMTDLVQASMVDLPAAMQAVPNIFWQMVRTLDTYIRRWRAEKLVNCLKTIPDTLIIGDGWEHIDRASSAAQFLPAMPARELLELYPRARVIANSNPYFRYGLHERTIGGLRSGAAVITDANDFTREHFSGLENLCQFEWHEDDEMVRERCLAMMAQDWSAHAAHSCATLDKVLDGKRLLREIEAIVAKVS